VKELALTASRAPSQFGFVVLVHDLPRVTAAGAEPFNNVLEEKKG
jgi:hypothetical protein